MARLADSHTVDLMRRAGIALTRENFIALNWGDDPPEPWTAGLEAEIPEELQDWTKVPIEAAAADRTFDPVDILLEPERHGQ